MTKLLIFTKTSTFAKTGSRVGTHPPSQTTGTIQALFVCTGCDYVSFFPAYGIAISLKTFLEKAGSNFQTSIQATYLRCKQHCMKI